MNDETNNRLIELTDDETGEKVKFEHLDSIDYKDNKYFVLAEYVEDEPEDCDNEYDVYVMRLVEEDGEESLEIVDDKETINGVFDEFKIRAKDEYEFVE